MWLPAGIRALSEIRGLTRPEDRIPAYATLLELVLRTYTPDIGVDPTLNNLIEFHRFKFTNVDRVFFANAVRNDLIHAKGEYPREKWQLAGVHVWLSQGGKRFLKHRWAIMILVAAVAAAWVTIIILHIVYASKHDMLIWPFKKNATVT